MQILPGRLPRALARAMPRAVAADRATASFSDAGGFPRVAKLMCLSFAASAGLLFRLSLRNACPLATNTAWRSSQSASLPFASSARYSDASLAGVPCSALNRACRISMRNFALCSPALPKPTSSTRSAAIPGSLCNSRVEADLPLMSPCAMRSLKVCLQALSSACAAFDNLPPSYTPTTTHALFCFSGLPCFMLNSTRLSPIEL